MKFLSFLFVLGIFGTSLSLDVTDQRVIYHSNKRRDPSTGIITTDLNRIFIKDKSKLEWQDGHGLVKYALNVKNVTGSLSLENSGQITYQVSSDKMNGRFTVKKTNGMITISAMLISEGTPIVIDFEVGSYTIINE